MSEVFVCRHVLTKVGPTVGFLDIGWGHQLFGFDQSDLIAGLVEKNDPGMVKSQNV